MRWTFILKFVRCFWTDTVGHKEKIVKTHDKFLTETALKIAFKQRVQ